MTFYGYTCPFNFIILAWTINSFVRFAWPGLLFGPGLLLGTPEYFKYFPSISVRFFYTLEMQYRRTPVTDESQGKL